MDTVVVPVVPPPPVVVPVPDSPVIELELPPQAESNAALAATMIKNLRIFFIPRSPILGGRN
jgi:hypothetical protein